ncbi:hypothetical protein GH742_14010 [Legionella sp. MW5194]|uniref:hypothetical protein n=1 Tax=Legionella sp. MW5194 TaxID=2662448 RepID=UPI00193DB00D|nr:hypothetical protein [Legionella sp. MW5194]QRN04882.1 hypothetical protein GH742_14010 [Legionella sp. MW5194]
MTQRNDQGHHGQQKINSASDNARFHPNHDKNNAEKSEKSHDSNFSRTARDSKERADTRDNKKQEKQSYSRDESSQRNVNSRQNNTPRN